MSEAIAVSPGPSWFWDQATVGRAIALLLPIALLGGAIGSQYLGGLQPCEMCVWQRWPHGIAIVLAALAFTANARSVRSKWLVVLAALAIATSGAIGVYHAGVEAKIFEGITSALRFQERLRLPRCSSRSPTRRWFGATKSSFDSWGFHLPVGTPLFRSLEPSSFSS